MSYQPAARVGDPIAHTDAMSGLMKGLVIGLAAGVLIGATIATGGGALVVMAGVGTAMGLTSAGALGGMYIGEASTGPACGAFTIGSPNVLINGRPATFTGGAFANCSKESGGAIPLASGASTVVINTGFAGRVGETLGCSAKSISQASPNVFIGGESAQDPSVTVSPEVPLWAVRSLEVLGVAGALLALPAAIASVGVAATIGGGVLGYAGAKGGAAGGRALGHALGLSESATRALEVGGGMLGGAVGGAAGTKGTQAFNARYQIKVDPNALGMNGGNIQIVPRPQPGGQAQELGELFDPAHPRRGITIGDRTVLADPANRGKAKLFDGVSDSEVKSYFSDVTGQPLPPARIIPPSASNGGGELYYAQTPQGSYNLRSFSSSGAQSGAKWTIDVPRSATGTGQAGELKFR